MDFLVKPLVDFFGGIHYFFHSTLGIQNLAIAYLLDLFVFTAIIKFLLLPLTIKQTKSTRAMSSIQPKMKEIQDKYKKDPQMLQQKQMQLYKEAGVNPLAGCLPLLIQFPIFIAMYSVVRKYQFDVEFFKQTGSWAKLFTPQFVNLLPLLALAIISGLTTYVSGRLMAPKGNDPSAQTQKKMNLYMSIFFVYMSFSFPVGLVIYWIISNLIQLGQQYFIINRIKHKEEEEGKLVK